MVLNMFKYGLVRSIKKKITATLFLDSMATLKILLPFYIRCIQNEDMKNEPRARQESQVLVWPGMHTITDTSLLTPGWASEMDLLQIVQIVRKD